MAVGNDVRVKASENPLARAPHARSHSASLLLRFRTLLGLQPEGPRRFADDARDFRKRLVALREYYRVTGSGARTAFLVTPWMRTAVPFFSLECVRLAAERGLQPAVIWDEANVVHNAEAPQELAALRELVALVRGFVPVAEPGEEEADVTAPEDLLFESFVRYARGERLAHTRLAAEPEACAAFRTHYRRAVRLLETLRAEHLVVPGGLWGLAGIYRHAAQRLGIPITTFDSGTGLLALSHIGVTAHNEDVATAWREFLPRVLADSALRERVTGAARQSLDSRIHGRDRSKLQTTAHDVDSAPPCDLLIPLNFRMDAAAMLRQRVFRGVEDWLTAILDWLEQRPGVTAVIRQHPCERNDRLKGSDDWSEFLTARPALADRVRYVSAHEPLNTYSLLLKCKAVLPYTSRVGVEAGLLGIPAIVATHSYYSETDFVFRAEDRARFGQLLDRAVHGELKVSEEQQASAALVYTLIEECSLLRTPFTPGIENFRTWVKVPRERFEQLDYVSDFLTALFQRRALPALLFARRFLSTLQPADA